MISNSVSYSTKIWLSSVIIAPLLLTIINIGEWLSQPIAHRYLNEMVIDYFAIVIFQFIFSLITWVLFLLLIQFIIRLYPKPKLQKPIIAVVGVLLTVGSFRLTLFEKGFYYDHDFIYLMIFNCLCISWGSFFYKLDTAA